MCSKVVHPLLPPPPPPFKKRKKITSLKKLKPSRSGKNINICEVKNVTIIGAPAKNCQGGGKTKNTPTTYGERDPPHGENSLYVERKDCPHRKNTPLGETPPPPPTVFIGKALNNE